MRYGLVGFLCLVPRIVALSWFPPDPSVLYYWAESEHVFSDLIRLDGEVDRSLEPLYPALLALFRTIAGDRLALVVLAQAVVAALTGILIYGLAGTLAGRRAAIVATVLYAFDPYLVRQSIAPVEITLCTTLLAGAAWVYARRDSPRGSVLTGLLLSAAALTRFSLLPVAAGGLGLLLWRRRWSQAVAFGLAVALPVAGWMLRLHALTGALVPTRVGINLFVSTNEYAGQIVPLRNVDLLVPWAYDTIAPGVVTDRMSELDRQRAANEALFERAVDYVREHPVDAIGLKLKNLAWTLVPVLLPFDRTPRGAAAAIEGGEVRVSGLEPRPLTEHAIYSASRLVLLAGTIIGLARRRGRWQHGDGLLLVVVASVIAVQTVFFPTSRLLAPMAFVLMVYCGIGLAPFTLRFACKHDTGGQKIRRHFFSLLSRCFLDAA
jgi:4-amino-4-deoxy-L-arabinose transferase-like glycosyltransferase